MKGISSRSAILLVVSVSTVGILAIAGTEATAAESAPTEIDSCTTISEPGRYAITRNLTPEIYELEGTACIEVAASDVVIDGHGHRVLGNYVDQSAVRVSADDRRLSNVTVKNINVGTLAYLTTAIRYEGVDGGAVSNVNATAGSEGVNLINASNIIVRESAFEGTRIFSATTAPVGDGVTVWNTSGTVIMANTFRGFMAYGEAIRVGGRSTNTTIASNHVRGCAEDDQSCLYNIEEKSDNIERGIEIGLAIGTTVVNNIIESHVTGIRVGHGNFVGNANETTRIANNTITGNRIGVQINVAQQPVMIRHNEIADNDYGIFTPALDDCVWAAAGIGNVGVHRNDLANNSAYGILNERSFSLNATHNYWGAASGPSSAADSDAPFADPVTGTLADGAGDAIPEDPGDPGVSNVHFDSSLTESVTNSSTESVS